MKSDPTTSHCKSDRESSLTDVIEAVVRHRKNGDRASDESVIAAHRELMPELAEALQAIHFVEEAQSEARSRDESKGDAVRSDGPTLPPDSIPGYSLLGDPRRGGQGVVYRAVQAATNRNVAIKFMRGGLVADASERARFDREIRMLAQLRHPNIVTIFDSGASGTSPYFVMDWIDGDPLDVYTSTRALTLRDKLRLFGKLSDAVSAAHARGIIHRDLKPGNILVDARGEPFVLDFGLAAHLYNENDSVEPSRAITKEGQFIGSLPWASPEQAAGRSDEIDVRTDVYALGLILYHLLTGRYPYAVMGKLQDVLRNIAETEPRRPSAVNPKLDDEMDAIVLKCLAKEPGRRYQSVAAATEDLRRYLSNEPILARAPSTMYQIKKLVRRHRLPSALLMTLFISLIGFAVSISMLYARATVERDRANRERVSAEAVTHFLLNDLLVWADVSATEGRALSVVELTAKAAERIDDSFPDQPQAQASLHQVIGGVYLNLGKYAQAVQQLRKAEAMRVPLLAATHPDMVQTRMSLTEALQRYGLTEEATRMAERNYFTCRDALGSEEPRTLGAALEYARCLFRTGRNEEGAKLLGSTLQSQRQILGEEHPETLRTMNIFAQEVLDRQGRHVEAETLLRQVVDTSERVFGPTHRSTLGAMNALGKALFAQRRLDEAELQFQTAYERFVQVVGSDHLDTLSTVEALARVRAARGLKGEARALYRQILEVCHRTLGSEHPFTVRISARHAALEPHTKE